jgi:hypothetical protein
MRNMLALFGAALLTVVGAGWYLGWYKVRSQPASVPGQHDVNINIDTNKISQDLQQGEQKLQQWLEKKNGQPSKKADGELMLPSPAGGKTSSNSKKLFPFHSDKGLTGEISNEAKHLLQTSAGDKK